VCVPGKVEEFDSRAGSRRGYRRGMSV
jgi:hypothetical protein